MSTQSDEWLKCWVSPDRLVSGEDPSYWVRHALRLCDRVLEESTSASELSAGMLDLIAAHFCAREAYLIGALASNGQPTKVLASIPTNRTSFDRDPSILDYVFDTGLAVCAKSDDEIPITCVPLRRPPQPRVTGALVLVRTWDTPCFNRHDVELISVFGHGLMSMLGAVFAPTPHGRELKRALRHDLQPSRTETETCRRSKLHLPNGRSQSTDVPLTIGAVFPDQDFQLPTYLQSEE